MRLLSRNESGKISPTVFTGTTPPYAILSHNWGGEEFIFDDLVNDIGKSKTGYRKIEFCAKQAAQDQLQYFWADTCCIDKYNLLEFFSSAGYRLGDKRSLEQLIHEITSIPVKALRNHLLDEFSIPERMAWASNRETTEPEDNAYCLLGILNVLMPPSYGEGKDNALKRLQSELEAVNGTPFIVPFSQNHRFIGQESQITELEGRLFAGSQTTKIAITGPRGIGKSQLSLELAYRTRQRYENCSIFWIPASDMNSFHNACAHIAEKLKIPGWDDEKVDVKKLVQLHLSRKSAGQWLLIYDNADDARLGFAGMSTPQATSLNDYIPQSELGTIIFTTADSNTAQTLASPNIVELQEMTLRAAQRMLEKYLDNPALTNEQHETTILLKELSYLPLAIMQAAAYVNVNKETTIKDLTGQEDEARTNLAHKCALTLLTDGRYNEAEELFVQVMETRKRVLGEEHPSTLTSMANLASTFWNQGRWKEAEELQANELQICSRVLGEEHPDTLTSMANLAFTLKAQGCNDDAISLMEKCFELRKRILGPQHPDTTSSLKALTKWRLENMEIKR
ncbi:hypothetical protein DL771_001024 [Monosporascus sp. 5C6A]|nr:hypothetical protein DL771_001024 [Monosporascus sp. 5C6A]